MNFIKKLSKHKDKIFYLYDYGRGKGQRPSTGVFTYIHPKTPEEKNHNKEALKILSVKKSNAIIDEQAVGTQYIPNHKFEANFYDYYAEYVKNNKRKGNRHLENSYTQFVEFNNNKASLAPVEMTEQLCKRFRTYLLDKYNGETPLNYYNRFKEVVRAAAKQRYFLDNPVEDIKAKASPSKSIKENLEVEDYLALLKTPCWNQHVADAFIFSMYTGLRWCDIAALQDVDITDDIMIKRLVQTKTGVPMAVTLHPVALSIVHKIRRERTVLKHTSPYFFFALPSRNAANGILKDWMKVAGINKKITWSCARLSFSILLQDKNVDDATVAYLMGHTTTNQVRAIYKRHRPKNEKDTLANLPNPAGLNHNTSEQDKINDFNYLTAEQNE